MMQPSLADLAAKLTLTVDEAALLTGIGRNAIREAIHNRALATFTVGRHYHINREDLDAWRLALTQDAPAAEKPKARVVPFQANRR